MPDLDEYGRHEALHMSLFLCEAVDSQLLQHGQIKNTTEWLTLAAKAHQALFDLYQAIGEEHLKGETK